VDTQVTQKNNASLVSGANEKTDVFQSTSIVYGVWRFLAEPVSGNRNMIRRLVDLCLDLQIDTFDHADIYGGYQCEALFGEVCHGIPRDHYKIVTKCGIKLLHPHRPQHKIKSYDTSAAHIAQSVEQSLRNLRTDFLDCLLIHRPDPLMDASEVAEQFEALYRAGKVRSFGVSNFTPQQFNLLQSYVRVPLVTNQVQCSLLYHQPLTDGTFDHAQEHRYRPMIWSPLGGGKIFTSQTTVAENLLKLLKSLGSGHGCSPEALCLAWLIKHPSRPIPVLGTMNAERLRSLAQAPQVSLSREEWFMLYEAALGQSVP